MQINSLLKTCSLNSYLYNLNLTLTDENLQVYHGVKYICMQGSIARTKVLANKLACALSHIDTAYFEATNLIESSAFHCYRVGKVLIMSHGIGCASILTLLHNISKVMYFAGNHDVEYIRLGTSGGIGLEPGSVVLTDTAYMPNLVPGHKMSVLGRDFIYPTGMDTALNQRILNAQPKELGFKVLSGNSIAADDFYLGQARLDGMLKPSYDEKKRHTYFEKIKQLNILNFEMESTALASFCNRAEIPATMIASTLVDRMFGDQITASAETLTQYADRAHTAIINFLKAELS